MSSEREHVSSAVMREARTDARSSATDALESRHSPYSPKPSVSSGNGASSIQIGAVPTFFFCSG